MHICFNFTKQENSYEAAEKWVQIYGIINIWLKPGGVSLKVSQKLNLNKHICSLF